MSEYIDRCKLIEEGWHLQRTVFGDNSVHIERASLLDIPAADVRPVVKAAWEQVEVRYEDELIDNPVQAVASMFCPNCKRYHNEVYFYGMPTERVNFCQNCGADMREVAPNVSSR